jgi:hypothetical protein
MGNSLIKSKLTTISQSRIKSDLTNTHLIHNSLAFVSDVVKAKSVISCNTDIEREVH